MCKSVREKKIIHKIRNEAKLFSIIFCILNIIVYFSFVLNLK